MHAFYEDRPAEINQQFVVAKRASVEVRVNPTKDQVARLAWEAEVDRVEITQSGVVNVDGGPEAWKLNARATRVAKRQNSVNVREHNIILVLGLFEVGHFQEGEVRGFIATDRD